MKTGHAYAMWLAAAVALLPAVNACSADVAPPAGEPSKDDGKKAVNPPKAAEPVKPGTLDKPPQPVAPGTLDAPPKPAAPGTLDKNVINPDVEIQKSGKPIPR